LAVAAILLAGGESRRMGSPKPLLPWDEETLVEYQLRQLRAAGADTVVAVLGHEADAVRPLVHNAGAKAIVNELYREGRASSVRVGAAALGDDTEAVIVLNVDQPRPAEVTRRLLEEHGARRALVSVPVHAGKRGHPVILAGSLLREMREVREETQGLRAVTERPGRDVNEVEFDSPVVLLDLNEPGDYEAARREFFGTAADT
jgi:CTP:molybdopterin cytidylyltransferase MocA